MRRLPEGEGDTPTQKPCTRYPIGSFHLALAAVRTAAGKLGLFVAIARTAKFAEAERHPSATTAVAAQFLRNLLAAGPDRLQTILPDDGLPFTNRAQDT